MSVRLLFPAWVLAVLTVPAVAAEECPAAFDERVALLEHASSCEKSLALFQGCSYGASGDVGLSQIVVRKCEADFLTKLSKSQRQGYDRQQKRCARKYHDQSGTMYRSFEAFCSAILAKDYSRRFAKGSKSY